MSRSVLRSLDNAGNINERHLITRALPHLIALFALTVAIWCSIAPSLLRPDYKDVALAVFGALLAFCGLIIGFIANLMLFTGKIESAAMLTLEETLLYSGRIRCLLHSQALTLAIASAASLLCVFSMISVAIDFPFASRALLLSVTLAYSSSCVVRSVLLPLQLYELHDAWLSDLAEAKARELRAKYGH